MDCRRSPLIARSPKAALGACLGLGLDLDLPTHSFIETYITVHDIQRQYYRHVVSAKKNNSLFSDIYVAESKNLTEYRLFSYIRESPLDHHLVHRVLNFTFSRNIEAAVMLLKHHLVSLAGNRRKVVMYHSWGKTTTRTLNFWLKHGKAA